MSVSVTLVGSKDRQLEELLHACGMRATHLVSGDLSAMASPAAALPDVLLIDQREQTSLPSGLTALKRQHPSIGVVIVATRLDPALLLDAMRAGVNEWVTDPVTKEELEAAIKRVVPQQAVPVVGQVFAFLGAKGGVGNTTIAVNVATALAKVTESRALLIDLHTLYGDAALFLGAEPRFSIADALENTHRLDETFLRGLVVRTKAGLDLLGSSERATVAAGDARRIRAVVEFAARHYRYVVLDCPRSDPVVMEALQSAARIIIVANQELATVRNAGRMAALLRQRYGGSHIVVVVSRYDAESEIRQEDIERVIGGSVKQLFPSDYRRALAALNRGCPLVIDNHHNLAGSLTTFAHALGAVEAPKLSPERASGLFGRLTGKRSA